MYPGGMYTLSSEFDHQACHVLANLCWTAGYRAGDLSLLRMKAIVAMAYGFHLDWSRMKQRPSGPQNDDICCVLQHTNLGVFCSKHLTHLSQDDLYNRILQWCCLPSAKVYSPDCNTLQSTPSIV